MSKEQRPARVEDRLAFYMDLLGHDVLNNNQAVMSYLELILASPGIDKNVSNFAEKAVSHVRTSTILIDNVKRLVASRTLDLEKMKPTDLVKAIDLGESQVRMHFPAKRIHIEKVSVPKSAMVVGNNYAIDLVLNVFVTATRLTHGDDISLRVALSQSELNRIPTWTMTVEDKAAQLPPFVNGEGVASTYAQDTSTAVKCTGLLYAKFIATALGGDFEAHSIHHDPKKKGAVYTVILRKAGKQ